MRDVTDLLHADALSPDDRAALAEALAADPALAGALQQWSAVQARLRADLSESLPEPDLLVLHALAGDPDALTEAERARLDAAAPRLREALASHPGAEAAVQRIRADRDLFDSTWAEHVDTNAPAPSRSAERPRASDRALAPASRRPTRWVWRAAALVAVVGFASVLTLLALRDAGFETLRADEARMVELADGSRIEMAAGAVLMVPGSGHDDPRQARLLAGQALFEIVHDPAQPFEVQTVNADITVLGTTFGVTVGEAQTEVVLVQGAVELAPRETPEAAVRLAPGQSSRVIALDPPSEPAAADLAASLTWTGSLVARDLPAAEIARRLAEQTGQSVTVEAPLGAERLSGSFPLDPQALEETVETLALSLGGRAEPVAGGFVVRAD